MIPARIIQDLQEERAYQLTKGRIGKIEGEDGWSYDFDNKNTEGDWIKYIIRYLGRTTEINQRQNLIKVATLAIAAVETLDRQKEFAKAPNDL